MQPDPNRPSVLTCDLSSWLQAHAQAEEHYSGAWAFEFLSDVALCEAGLARSLPVPTAMEDDAISTVSNSILDLLPFKTQVAAAEGAHVTLPPPNLCHHEAQVWSPAFA